ncbi:ABC transporter substrate-binding protein [Asticcacaulis endophyticus]|uniref:Putative aliphatic sulfonates-binding protein n=1 Tax=Asticcacaulis endophyticus TaxID=1395890 RepID=A0A918Q1Z2_9CAUL|nr:ABC transporter substrate-binding protein [Asticcacaulis endophyticus]GGZ30981.1 sulfonate ABC transporter substrate-binding protein [Asticcacaulis endophyticus]
MERRSFLALSALTVGLAACGQSPKGQTKLILGDQQRGLRIPVEAANALEGADYQVEWANFSNPTSLFEASSSGAVDTLMAIDNLVLLGAIVGRPYKIVAHWKSASDGIGIVVPANSPIKTVADLKGRKVIVSTAPGGTADGVFYAAIREAGLKDDDVKPGYMLQPDALAAFERGNIDAWATNDPNLARVEATGARLLRNGVGINKSVSFLAASDQALNDPARRVALKDVLHRIATAFAWSNDNLEAYAKIYSEETQLSPGLALTTLSRRGRPELKPITPQTIADAQVVADHYAARGIFPRKADVTGFFDTTLFT